MECFKILAVGIFFVVRMSYSQTIPEEPVTPVLKEYINNEMRRIEKVFTKKVEELVEITRNENVLLKRENNILITKLYKERRNNFKQISELKDEMKVTEKHYMRKMKALKDLTITELLEKTREIDALKDEIRVIKLANELTNGHVKQLYNIGDNSDQGKSDNSKPTFRGLGNTNNLGRGTLKDEHGDPCDTCKDIHRSRRMLNPASGTHVAFFARLTNKTPNLAHNQDIVFDHVVTNVGNGYHGNHGLFVAPVSGLYVISATVMAFLPGPSLHISHAKVVKNGQLLAILGQHGVSVWDTSSVTIVVELQKGDDVAVQNSDQNLTFWGDNFCTFSGFLLYENAGSPNLIGK